MLHFILGLCAVQLAAQTPAYLHYGVRDGLPSNLVYCGLQDRDGLLWFATDKGLARFDGLRFRTYGMADGLPDPEVFNLKEDSRGRMWMFCFSQKPCYRLDGKIVTAIQDSMLAKINFETALGDMTEDGAGNCWISGYSSFLYKLTDSSITSYKLNGATNVMVNFSGQVIAMSGGQGGYFLQEPQGNWVSRSVAGLAGFDTKIISAAASSKRMLWSTVAGLYLLEPSPNGGFVVIDHRKDLVGRICVDRQGRFWVCSLASGAYCFDNNQQDLSNPVVYLPGKKISMLVEDQQGTLWFCTAGEGVYMLPQNTPVLYGRAEGLVSRNITAVARDVTGRLLAGDDEGNLYTLNDSGHFTMVSFGSSDGYNRVRQIAPRPDGSRWVVTDEGLHYEKADPIRPGNFIRRSAPPNAGHPKEISISKNGQIFVATSARLYKLVDENADTTHLTGRRKTTVDIDDQDNVWVGGIEEVLSERDRFRANWSDSFRLLHTRIVTLRRGEPGKLWIVTPENGLLRASLRNGGIDGLEIINQKLSAPIYNIQSLFSEPGGRLWMATNRGIYGLDQNWLVVHFDGHDGLADDDVNAVLAHRDTLWAATANGLTRLLLRPPDTAGDFATLITQLRYRLQDATVAQDLLDSWPPDGKITLPAGASLVQLELTGLDYRSRGNLYFRCTQTQALLPVQWWTPSNLVSWIWHGFRGTTDTTAVDEALLSFGVRLPPGAYRLRVTAVTTAGVESRQPSELILLMPPMWYENLWFMLLLWVLGAYGLWRIYRARLAFRVLDASVSVLQLQALRAQINPHFVGNSINAIQQFFYPPDPVRASEYIAMFTGLLRRTLLFSEKNFIPFKEELAYDRDYLQLIELRFGERFQFEITGAARMPTDLPFPAMLLQTLLENATIHGLAPEGISRLRLDFSWDDKKLICTVIDNGVGIETSLARKRAAGTERASKGLEMLQHKIETLNRLYAVDLQLDLRELPGGLSGTCATLSFFPHRAPAITEQVWPTQQQQEPMPTP